MQEISQYFVFNKFELAGLISLALLLIVVLYFYCSCYLKPLRYARSIEGVDEKYEKDETQTLPKVSVVIESENEAQQLADNLPLILEQDYPNFEVVIVNKGSTDESDDVLQDLCTRHPNLYHTFIPNSYDKSLSTRKLAITVGIKAAKGEILLFTEAYSRPVSNQWISLMVDGIVNNGKDVSLGYSYYKKTPLFFNRIARFDNLLFSMQYLSMSLKDKPYTGVYRNIAFNKSKFFDNKGFAAYLGVLGGEEVFIHDILNADNTEVVVNPDSFTETNIDSYSLWKQIKKSYSYAQSNFKGLLSRVFSVEYFTRYLFYGLFIYLLVYSVMTEHWGMLGISIVLFLVKTITNLVVFGKISNYFNSGKFILSYPILELAQPLYNLKFRSRQKRHRH